MITESLRCAGTEDVTESDTGRNPAPLNTALWTDSAQVSIQQTARDGAGGSLKEGSCLDQKCRGDHVQREGK